IRMHFAKYSRDTSRLKCRSDSCTIRSPENAGSSRGSATSSRVITGLVGAKSSVCHEAAASPITPPDATRTKCRRVNLRPEAFSVSIILTAYRPHCPFRSLFANGMPPRLQSLLLALQCRRSGKPAQKVSHLVRRSGNQQFIPGLQANIRTWIDTRLAQPFDRRHVHSRLPCDVQFRQRLIQRRRSFRSCDGFHLNFIQPKGRPVRVARRRQKRARLRHRLIPSEQQQPVVREKNRFRIRISDKKTLPIDCDNRTAEGAPQSDVADHFSRALGQGRQLEITDI